MAEVMQVELVSPERKLASMKATMIQIPAAEGDMTAMPNHAPVVSSLRPGVLRIVAEGGDVSEFVVSGGFAELSPEGTSILAEEAMKRDEVTPEFIATIVSQAEAALELATDEISKASAAMRLNDVKFIQSQLG